MLSKNLIYFLLGVVLLVHTVILTKLIYFPYPELFIYPYLTNHGLKPYSQILDQHFPGLMFFPINLNNLGLVSLETARTWSEVSVLIVQIMLFLIGREILKSNTKAILVNILYLIWQPFFEGWVLWIDNFLPLLLLPAFYLLYRGNQGNQGNKGDQWFFWSGLFLGLGIVFKQTIIPLAVFVLIYIFWKTRRLRSCLRFLLGVFIPVGLMVGYLVSIGVFWDFWYWTVIFNLTTYAKEGRGGGPTLAHFSRAMLVFGSAFFVLLRIKLKEAQILLIFLIGTLLGLSTRFDFVHLQPALPFAVLATVYGFEGLGKLGRFGGWGRLGIVIGYLGVSIWWLNIFYKGHLGDRVISFEPTTKEIAIKIKNYTNPYEKIFIYGAQPHLYQMSDTLPAGDVFVFQFPWFLKVAEGRILEGIKTDKPNIIVSDRTVIIEGAKIIDFAFEIDQYLRENYQKIDSIGTTDILQRKN